jgi:hypothetical protein
MMIFNGPGENIPQIEQLSYEAEVCVSLYFVYYLVGPVGYTLFSVL